MRVTTNISQWWVPVVAGAVLVLMAIFLLMQPVEAFMGMTLFFGWLIILHGGFNVSFALRNRYFLPQWKWYMGFAVVEVLVGLTMLFQPEDSAESLMVLFGFWLLFAAVSKIASAWALRRYRFRNWELTMALGVAMLVYSLFVVFNPVVGMLSMVYLISIPFLLIGLAAIFFGLQMRKFKVSIHNEQTNLFL